MDLTEKVDWADEVFKQKDQYEVMLRDEVLLDFSLKNIEDDELCVQSKKQVTVTSSIELL